MSELHDFESRIQRQFATDSQTPHWTPEEAKQFKLEIGVHHQRFEHLAFHLISSIIRPRLEILGSYFPIADLIEERPPHHCTCCIGYTQRVPATTMVTFAVEHDAGRETMIICYDVHMTPRLVRLSEHNTLTLAFDEIDDAMIADWVETRLLELLDAYLQVDIPVRSVKERPELGSWQEEERNTE